MEKKQNKTTVSVKQAKPKISKQKISLLYVEDNKSDADLFRNCIQTSTQLIIEYRHVKTLHKALEELQKNNYDLVVLELNLPDSKGIDSFTRVNTNAPDTPIVVLTGNCNEELALNIIKRGGQDFLQKDNFNYNMLPKILHYSIERHRLHPNLNYYTKKINATEKLFSAIINQSLYGIIIVDKNGTVKFINPAATRLLGWSFEEIFGENFGMLATKDKISEINLLMKNGISIVAEVHSMEIEWEGENVSLLTIRDITERKKEQKELQNERDRAQKYLDIAGIMFIVLDEQGNITLINKKGTDILGYEQDEFIGKNWFKSFLPSSINKEVKALFNQLIAGKLNEDQFYENMVLTKNGQEKIIAWHNTPLKNEEGKIVGTLSSGQDITERKLSEEKLLNSENRYRSLFNNNPVSLWEEDWTEVIAMVEKIKQNGVTDLVSFFNSNPGFVNEALAKVKILDVNNETLIMFNAKNKSQMLDSLAIVFATDDTMPGFVDELIALASGNLLYETEMSLNTVDGKLINTFLRMNFPGKDARSGQVIVSIMDISEIKKAQEAIRNLNENLERLVIERTQELENKNDELNKAMKVFVGRELKIRDLQKKINALQLKV